jgi:hypothetical protein
MMTQQLIALIFIFLFATRLFQQKNKKQINGNEFVFWLAFWGLGALAIIFIRQLDRLLDSLGFSGSGINFLLYLAVLSLFYLIFKLRLKISKLEKSLTDLVREIALKK